MHIVFLTSEYPKKGFPHGGVGTVVQNMARGLVKNGLTVSIIGLNYIQKDEVEDDHGVIIYRYKPKKVKLITWYLNFQTFNKALKELNSKQPIDIVESTELGLAFIQKLKGVKYLIRMNGGHHFFAESENRKINWWKGYQEKRSFKKADHVIGVSEYVVKHTSKYLNFKDKYKGVFYNLANLERFQPTINPKTIKGRIFFAGSICEKKGIRQLILAMEKVIDEFPSAHLVIAGRDTIIKETGKSYLEFLKTSIPDAHKEKIIFLGNVENNKLSKEIDKSEVCVYPSHMEAMPLAWLEVLSMGKPFIGSKLGPGLEVVKDKQTGLLCNPHDIKDISDAIILILGNPSLAREFGRNALNDIKARFSKKELLKKNILLYYDITN
jgi:glycosyltransferase involved in cell wall biosynthesis